MRSSSAYKLLLLHHKVPVLAGGEFSPSDISGLKLWLRADDIAGSDADLVAAWNDRSGNGNNFAQGTTTNKPTLKKAANGINGHNVLRFAVDNYMLGSNFLSGIVGAAFFIYRPTDVQDNQSLLTSSDEATANYYVLLRGMEVTGGPCLACIQKNNDTVDDLRGDSIISINTPYIVAYTSNGSTTVVRLNGSAETLTPATGANNGDWFGDVEGRDNVVIGAFKSTSVIQFLYGDLAEVIVYDGVSLSNTQIQKIENYLSDRYNINFT